MLDNLQVSQGLVGVKDLGADWAAEFATAHERNPSSHPTPVSMDLHNNEFGRRIAMENPDASPDELARLVEQPCAMGDGRDRQGRQVRAQ